MAAELVRGQNHPLAHTRVEITVAAGGPVLTAVALGDEQGRLSGPDRVVHAGTPSPPGVEVPSQACVEPRLLVDLGALHPSVQRVSVILALPPGGPAAFGGTAAPFLAVTAPDGSELASYTVTGLDTESALVALELYVRGGSWKVRAIGQGYAGGLPALLADHGLVAATELAAGLLAAGATHGPGPGAQRSDAPRTAAPAAQGSGDVPGVVPAAGSPSTAPIAHGLQVPSQGAAPTAVDYVHPRRRVAPAASTEPSPPAPPAPVAGDAAGWTMEERLYNQVWGMFEDLARTVAAYRSAVAFAETRLEQELDQVLSDPRHRLGDGTAAARAAAEAKHDRLLEEARRVLDRDLAQLTAEAEVVEPALPAAFAGWGHRLWQSYQLPTQAPLALRLGDIHLPECPTLRIPMLVRLPLGRGLWIDSSPHSSDAAHSWDSAELSRVAVEAAVALAVRMLAAHPAGDFRVHVIDAAGAAAVPLAPLVDSGVLAQPPGLGAAAVHTVLNGLTERVDLVQMALRAGTLESLPPTVDPAQQLLIVHDFPHGFDERAVTQLRYLADEGPAAGVHLLLIADREDAAGYGPLLDPLWRSLMRLTPVPGEHLADPWVGHAWTYEPLAVPPGSQVLREVLGAVVRERP
ncbi:TerD family protein [Streptomyces sp. NPDC006879]|uniref:TerD family protein n=1 Tax=Streptomyces sp. NPDC006879 TaxID=3364767 RepID=UPI0036B9C642